MSRSPRTIRASVIGAMAVLAIAFGVAGAQATAGAPHFARPSVPTPKPYVFPTVAQKTLTNGLHIVVLERHDLPLVVVRTVLQGGPLADPVGKEGTFGLMRMLINEGTSTRNPARLGAEFADMGSVVNDSGFVTTTANFDSSLVVLADLLRHPAFLASSVERARASRVDLAVRGKTSGNPVTSRVMASVLYGADHPFARFESEQSLAAITREDIEALHASWVRPPNVTILVVGDVTPAVAFAAAERWLGDWPRGTGGGMADLHVSSGPFAPPPTAIYLVDVPSPTTYIRIAGLSATRTSPDLPALGVLNAIYGELSGSRLFKELREKRKLSYSTRSGFTWRASPIPSTLQATVASVPNGQADSAIMALMGELRGIAGANPPTADEFDFGKQNRIATLPLQLETHEEMAGVLSDIVQQNLPFDFITGYVAGLRTVTPAQVIAAAARDIDPAHTAIIVVGDARVLEAKLRASNIAPVYVVDDRGTRIR